MSGKDRTRFHRIYRATLAAYVGAFCGLLLAEVTTRGHVAVFSVLLFVFATMAIGLETCVVRRRRGSGAVANRPHPDYISIAAMEREIYGETFRHDGTPQDGRGPIASTLPPKDRDPSVRLMCRLGHETRVRGTMPPRACPTCDEQRERRTRPAGDRPARMTSVRARSESFWAHIDEARRLTEQIKAANGVPPAAIGDETADDERLSNLRWERPS